MKRSLKFFLTISITLLINSMSYAQDQVGSSIKQGLNNGWVWAQAVLAFAIVLTTGIGILVVYSKKDSSQEGEFKKYVTRFAMGVLFLVVALSIISVIKNMVASSFNMSF
jgi:hypothetical protein